MGELDSTGNEMLAIKSKVLVADKPEEKLKIALTIVPETAFPVVKSKAPVGQPGPFDIVGVPKNALL